LTIFKSVRLSRDLDFIKNLSDKIDKKLSQSEKTQFDNLSIEELQDLSKISQIANFMLAKYEDKKEVRSILSYFVSIIHESAESIEKVNDEVSELIISAEDSINKIKEIHTNISEKYSFEDSEESFEDNDSNDETSNVEKMNDKFNNSSINLTKIAIEINSQEYQQNSTRKNIQVI